MKLELPFAILLLAIGGWLWMSHYPSELLPERQEESVSDSPIASQPFAPQTKAPSLSSTTPSQIQTASYNQPVSPFSNFEPGENDPGILLAQAAKKMELSPPITCKARCQINLFEQSIVGEGRYLQKGQGSGLTRLEINYAINDETALHSTQICDGKFHYWIQQLDDESTIEFIDLTELKSDKFNLDSGPTQWLTRSGTASLLRNLSAAFEFEPPQTTQIGEHEMIVLRGSWKRSGLQGLLHGQVNPDTSKPVRWDRLPPQLPHTVEVYLGTDDFLNLFPYRLSFYQFDEKQQLKPTPLMTMEFFEVEKVAEIPDRLFRVNANGSQQIDLSRNYSEHLQRMTEAAAETLQR